MELTATSKPTPPDSPKSTGCVSKFAFAQSSLAVKRPVPTVLPRVMLQSVSRET